MGYYDVNTQLYSLLRKVIVNTEIISVADISVDDTNRFPPRIVESNFVITEDVKRVSSFVTAHNLDEYRPNVLKLRKLVFKRKKLPIDLLREIRGGPKNGISLPSY